MAQAGGQGDLGTSGTHLVGLLELDPFDGGGTRVMNFGGSTEGGWVDRDDPLGSGLTWGGHVQGVQLGMFGSQILGGGKVVLLGFEDLVEQGSDKTLAHVLHVVVEVC